VVSPVISKLILIAMVRGLSNSGYSSYNFNRDNDIRCGAYGGKDSNTT
jgi:hypothetical protein